jgi:hypothetical protein
LPEWGSMLQKHNRGTNENGGTTPVIRNYSGWAEENHQQLSRKGTIDGRSKEGIAAEMATGLIATIGLPGRPWMSFRFKTFIALSLIVRA